MKRFPVALLCLLATFAFAQSSYDIKFADAMIQHHQSGIEMAQLAVDKAESAELRAMAQQMIDDQRRDIEQLRSLRGNAAMTPKTTTVQMPGMMSESEMKQQMTRLESASGHAFDLAFTEIMPMHHEGALLMSRNEIQSGSNEGLKALARTIVDKQTRERTQLIAMHDDMSAQPMAMTSSSSERERKTKN